MREGLDFIVDELWRIYQEKKPSGLPYNERTRNTLRKAAEICEKLDATPQQYADAIFSAIGKDKMQLAFLHCAEAKKHYHDFMERKSMSLSDLYDLQKMYLKVQITQAKRKVEVALMDDDLNFHPWFRICITKEPVEEIIEKYGEQAREEMNPRLKAFLEMKKLDPKRITNE